MNASAPLTEHEVEQLILTFWKMQEEKAHLVDLMEVTTPDIEISMGEFAWRGYRELEDHQMGSKAQFFDQHFEPRSISVELSRRERSQSTVRLTIPSGEQGQGRVPGFGPSGGG